MTVKEIYETLEARPELCTFNKKIQALGPEAVKEATRILKERKAQKDESSGSNNLRH